VLPKRRKRERMAHKDATVIRCGQHLQWVRGHECAAGHRNAEGCGGNIEAAHVRIGTDGGTSMKPSDRFVIPLCSTHHRHQHTVGETTFEMIYLINMRHIADALWDASPAGKKYRANHDPH